MSLSGCGGSRTREIVVCRPKSLYRDTPDSFPDYRSANQAEGGRTPFCQFMTGGLRVHAPSRQFVYLAALYKRLGGLSSPVLRSYGSSELTNLLVRQLQSTLSCFYDLV